MWLCFSLPELGNLGNSHFDLKVFQTIAPSCGDSFYLFFNQAKQMYTIRNTFVFALIFPVCFRTVPFPSAATLLWHCFTRLYGSTLTSLCCPRPCSTSCAPPPLSLLACCPVVCPSSLSCPWRRSDRLRFFAIQLHRKEYNTNTSAKTLQSFLLNLHRF